MTFGDELPTGRLLLHRASIEHLPLGDSSLDGVITVDTLYFVPELDRAFGELARVLNGSGRVVIGIGDPGVQVPPRSSSAVSSMTSTVSRSRVSRPPLPDERFLQPAIGERLGVEGLDLVPSGGGIERHGFG
jgi:SAM-dependent methyltransferase